MSLLFEQIISHREQAQQLQQSIARSAMPHALLFSGPKGIGKRSLALACAAELLSQNADDPQAHMRLVAAGNHPDLHIAAREEGKKEITVDSVRELRGRLQLKPYSASKVVALLLEAERMNSSAYNALLKTLEEPNQNTYLILTTDSLHALPETIRSRCQCLHFSALSEDALTTLLARLAPQITAQTELRESAVRLCQGSLSLLSLDRFRQIKRVGFEPSSEVDKHIRDQLERFQTLLRQIESLRGSRDTAAALSLASDVCSVKGEERLFWTALQTVLREHLAQRPSIAAAEALAAAVERPQLGEQRNLNQVTLASEVLHRCAYL